MYHFTKLFLISLCATCLPQVTLAQNDTSLDEDWLPCSAPLNVEIELSYFLLELKDNGTVTFWENGFLQDGIDPVSTGISSFLIGNDSTLQIDNKTETLDTDAINPVCGFNNLVSRNTYLQCSNLTQDTIPLFGVEEDGTSRYVTYRDNVTFFLCESEDFDYGNDPATRVILPGVIDDEDFYAQVQGVCRDVRLFIGGCSLNRPSDGAPDNLDLDGDDGDGKYEADGEGDDGEHGASSDGVAVYAGLLSGPETLVAVLVVMMFVV